MFDSKTLPRPLFQPDIFSSSEPLFSNVSIAVSAQLEALALKYWGNRIGKLRSIQQFVGNEINSNNFRVEGSIGTILLKKLPAKKEREALLRDFLLLDFLFQKGAPVPRCWSSAEGERLVTEGGDHWCAFEFLEGNFFRGGHSELTATAEAVGRLLRILKDVPDQLRPASKWEYFSAQDAAIFSRMQASQDDWGNIFGREMGEEIRHSWALIQKRADQLEANRAVILSSPVQATHYDIHPHNVLMSGARGVVLIDFESYTRMPLAGAAGYGIYKLIKQHASANGLGSAPDRIRSDAETFMRDMNDSFGERLADSNALGLCALAELFRRLILVFRLNLLERNCSWNHVLPMHLAGLEEIGIIFDY